MAGKMGKYTNYQAGLGLKGMQTVGKVVEKRRTNAERLISNLEDIIQFQKPIGPDASGNFMLVAAIVPKLAEYSARLLKAGVDTKHLYMRDCSRMFDGSDEFPNAVRAEQEVLHIPAHPHMSTGDIDRLSERIRAAVRLI
jgi:dTDP-4-amino-4,6-dideoxygalactose transaminase